MAYIRHITGPNKIPANPDRDPSTGLANCALNLARIQVLQGHQVEVWGYSPNGPLRFSWSGVDIFCYDDRWGSKIRRGSFGWLFTVWLSIKKSSPADIVHFHHWPEGVYLSTRNAKLLHFHWKFPKLSSRKTRRSMNHVDAVIFPSEFLQKSFLKGFDSFKKKSFVAYNAADPEAFKTACNGELKNHWGAKDNSRLVLYVGAITPEKGLLNLVEAFGRVKNDTSINFKLVVIGGSDLWSKPGQGNLSSDYEKSIRESVAGIDVHFAGAVGRNQMPCVYKAADIVVVPSIVEEAHPTVICEAMMAGKPVIASKIGGIPEIVIDNETGLLVAPGNDGLLADAIIKLGSDLETCKKMGRAGQVNALRYFTWERSASLVEEIYKSL